MRIGTWTVKARAASKEPLKAPRVEGPSPSPAVSFVGPTRWVPIPFRIPSGLPFGHFRRQSPSNEVVASVGFAG